MNGIKIVPLVGFLLLIILIAGRLIFLKKRGIRVSSDAKKSDRKSYLLYPLFFAILLIWLFEITKAAFQFQAGILPETALNPIVSTSVLELSGAVFIFAASIIMLLALLHFKKSLRFGLDKNNQGKLITTGVFSFSRNPFFLSIDFYFLGVALIFPSLFFIAFAVSAMVGIHFFILKEEQFLQKMYGIEYECYTTKTRRYF